MGQKVCPIGLRIGIIKTWDSKWYAEKNKYTELLHEDIKIRSLIKQEFYQAAISKIELERAASERVRIIINAARPGMIIGRKGQEIEILRSKLSRLTGKNIYLDIREVKRPETDAQLVAENAALQIERRVAYRRVMKRVISSALRLG
ncbi:MAG: 30S ribosomal protein S3, partial [Thermodesulfobacteriota bacterium]